MSDKSVRDDPPEKHIIVNSGQKPGGDDSGSSSASGSGGSKDNWTFSINSGGGAGGGFSGGFGGSSKRKARKRAKAKAQAIAQMRAEAQQRAAAEAAAQQQALREQALAAHGQLIDSLYKAHASKRVELDRDYAQKKLGLADRLEAEVAAASKAPSHPGDERWQLYLITKKKSEVDGLIAGKQTALQASTAKMLAFDGRNPLLHGGQDYPQQLAQRSGERADVAHELHQAWEASYLAAHESALLDESIRLLSDKSKGLAEHHAQEVIKWRKIEAVHEGYRKYEEQRERHISHHLRVEEDTRLRSMRACRTFAIPMGAGRRGAIVLRPNNGVVLRPSNVVLAQQAAIALQSQVDNALKELGLILAIRTGQMMATTIALVTYSPVLGNGELTPEQRRRLFDGVGVKAERLGLPKNTDLARIAGAGGSVGLQARIRPVPSDKGTELQLVSTGKALTAQVPVIMAVPDALNSTHTATTSGVVPRQLSFSTLPATAAATPADTVEPKLFAAQLLTFDLPAGIDTRFDDCIVCFAPELGLEPLYFTFPLQPAGWGIVTGGGAPATDQWRKTMDAAQGAAIPGHVGDRLRGREFQSLAAFDKSVWSILGEDPVISRGFDSLNVKRMAQGLAPYAPKATWVGERRHYELRAADAAAAQTSPFALDGLKITQPNSGYGVVRVVPAFKPWPTAGAKHIWTPVVVPGIDLLGPTTKPIAPAMPTVYPGSDTQPVATQGEALPAVDPAEAGARIPGYGEDDDLPPPGLEFIGPPVDPLEVGPYNDLSRRSVKDGMDIDHIVSRAAYERALRIRFPALKPTDIRYMSDRAPSIAIPAEIHRGFSETFKGRNSIAKQIKDASDIKAAVNSNFDAIKIGLLESGLSEKELEAAREKLHNAFRQEGWYK